jgi:DNA-binding IscR family transcriptional regulator
MISQRARYAFKALIVLARAVPCRQRGDADSRHRMKEQIPRKFLEQILLSLKAGGLIVSRRIAAFAPAPHSRHRKRRGARRFRLC